MSKKDKGKIRGSLKKPFWAFDAKPDDELPSWDFCREIIPPGENKNFPDGAVGIRVDADFWAVAALPLEYVDWKLEDIATDLWPHTFNATFHPDSGSQEQKIEWLEHQVYDLKSVEKGYFTKIRQLEKELNRHGYLARRWGLTKEPQHKLED